jgi:hypothetical protein
MNRELVLRRSLWAAAFFNVGGAVMFGFPSLPTGQMAGLPADVHPVYRAFVALFVLLFGGAYAWLAAQPAINRPFVAFGAIGKTCAFVTAVLLWLAGQIAGMGVAIFTGDLALAALFFWGLMGMRRDSMP